MCERRCVPCNAALEEARRGRGFRGDDDEDVDLPKGGIESAPAPLPP